MTWQLICPPGYTEMFTGGAPKSYSNSIKFSYREYSVLEIPPTNTFHLAINCSITSHDSSFMIIKSKNHKLIINTAIRNSGHFSIYQDDKEISNNVHFSLNKKMKIFISFCNNESNHMIIEEDGNTVFECKEELFSGEPVTSINFCDPYSDYSSFDLYWLIVSPVKLPNSITVREINPEIETDWEQGEQGVFQTEESGKTIKMKLPKNCVKKNKAFFSSVSYLKNVTGGGNVNSINIHTDGIDEDKIINITETPKAIGQFYAGETIFTTKE